MKLVPLIVKEFLNRKICQRCKRVTFARATYCSICYSPNLRKRREMRVKKNNK